MKSKVLCKIVKEIEIKDHLEIISKLVYQPEYLCEKCGRTAAFKKLLCHPVALDAPSSELDKLDLDELLERLDRKDEKPKKEKHKDKKEEKSKKEKHKHDKHKDKDKKNKDKSEKDDTEQDEE